jgi:hypothetical protein
MQESWEQTPVILFRVYAQQRGPTGHTRKMRQNAQRAICVAIYGAICEPLLGARCYAYASRKFARLSPALFRLRCL